MQQTVQEGARQREEASGLTCVLYCHCNTVTKAHFEIQVNNVDGAGHFETRRERQTDEKAKAGLQTFSHSIRILIKNI